MDWWTTFMEGMLAGSIFATAVMVIGGVISGRY